MIIVTSFWESSAPQASSCYCTATELRAAGQTGSDWLDSSADLSRPDGRRHTRRTFGAALRIRRLGVRIPPSALFRPGQSVAIPCWSGGRAGEAVATACPKQRAEMPCTARCPGRPSGSADRTNALDVQHLILREMLDVPSVGFATDLLLIGPLGLASGCGGRLSATAPNDARFSGIWPFDWRPREPQCRRKPAHGPGSGCALRIGPTARPGHLAHVG